MLLERRGARQFTGFPEPVSEFDNGFAIGVLPIRLGKKIAWDAAAMKASNAPEADPLIRKAYRAGVPLG